MYNGKELNSDFGLDWSDYGFRYYDAAIARFSSVDPLAENYSFQSPYVYASNNPILFIDFLGLGPIFGPDGRMIGYEVEKGQGPTQIAKDINDNYSSKIRGGDINYLSIVLSNKKAFENVENGDGLLYDINNSDYKSGNIVPGQELVISDGFDGLIEDQDNLISEADGIQSKINQAYGELGQLNRSFEDAARLTNEDVRGDKKDGAAGAAAAGVIKQIVIGRKQVKKKREIKELKKEKQPITNRIKKLEKEKTFKDN